MSVAPETAALGSKVLKKRRSEAAAAAHATTAVPLPSTLPADASKMGGGKRAKAYKPRQGGALTTAAQAKAAHVSASTHSNLIISTPIPDVHPIMQVPFS